MTHTDKGNYAAKHQATGSLNAAVVQAIKMRPKTVQFHVQLRIKLYGTVLLRRKRQAGR
jgi:hypothetical protein